MGIRRTDQETISQVADERRMVSFSFQRMGARIAASVADVRQTVTSLCGNTPDFPSHRVPGCMHHRGSGCGEGMGQGRMAVVVPSGGHRWLLRAVVGCSLRPSRRLVGAGRWNLWLGRNYPMVMRCLN